MKMRFAVLNLCSLLGLILVNFLSAIGAFGASIAQVSHAWDTPFTPADYAFSIWILIYVALLAFCLFQLRQCIQHKSPSHYIEEVGWNFAAANSLNALWVYVFSDADFITSSIALSLMLVFLYRIVLKLDMERWDAPLPILCWVWWPFSLYTAWVTLAAFLNFALVFKQLFGVDDLMREQAWTYALLSLSAALYAYLVIRRNMRESALVAVWGLIGIGVKNQLFQSGLGWFSLCAALALLCLVAVHGYQNWRTSPFEKWKRGESIWEAPEADPS